MERVFGCDISTWQDRNDTPEKVNFKKMMAAGAGFVFCRASFGLYPDTDFADYWRDAKAAGIPRGAYTFPLTTLPMASQIQKFIDLIKADPGELPPVLDIEKYQSTVPGPAALKTAIKMIEDHLGKKPIIYTGYYVWRDQVKGEGDVFFRDYPLWIAAYTAEQYIKVPKPWTGWTFWQYTDKGDGPKFGVESLNVDMDYFMGDRVAFDKFLGRETAAPVVGELSLEEKVERLWEAHEELHLTP